MVPNLQTFLQKDFALWLDRVWDAKTLSFHDRIEADDRIDPARERLLLVQARMAFSLAHLALLSNSASKDRLSQLALTTAEGLQAYRLESGLYGRVIGGAPLAYDQSFVLLALATCYKLDPHQERLAAMEALWQAAAQMRHEPSGLFWDGDLPLAQNPQMHFYEALLQAYEMTGKAEWLTRAITLRQKALAIFFDPISGSLAEFEGQERREFGHQYEWAWLLLREAEFAPDPDLNLTAKRLGQFAQRFGHAPSGAVYDAARPSGEVSEASCLLWPQTEAVKYFAITGRKEEALALMSLIFKQWFKGAPLWVNQIDPEGKVLQPQSFTRLFYHLVLAITEGMRAGLWHGDFHA